MTLGYKAGNRITGTSADRTGGTWTNLPAGWTFLETDTNPPLIYMWTGSAWRLQTEKDVTETLTGKTLTTPIIASISNTGTITLPTSTDTLMGKATTDTMTNKTGTAQILTDPVVSTTITTATAFPSAYSPYSVKKRGTYVGLGTSVSDGILGGNATPITVGTGTSGGISRVTGLGCAWRHTTGATINSIGGIRHNAQLFTERDFNPWVQWRLRINQTANTRCFFGFTSSNAAPTSGADQLSGLFGVMFGYDSGVDGNWHIYQNDATGTDSTTIANVAAAGTGIHIFALRADNANTKFQYSYDGSAWANVNTKIPAATTGLGITFQIENLTGSAMTMDVYYVEIIQDL